MSSHILESYLGYGWLAHECLNHYSRLGVRPGCVLGRSLEMFYTLGESLTVLAHEIGSSSEEWTPYGR